MLSDWVIIQGTVLLLLINRSIEQSGIENYSLDANETKSRIFPFSRDASKKKESIVFPDTPSDRVGTFSVKNGTLSCASSGLPYCEDVEYYPYSRIKEALQENTRLRYLFGSDEAPPDITNRLGDEDEKFVCHSLKQTIFPKIGETKNNMWKFIINQETDGFVQGIQVELCKNPEAACDIPGSLSLDSSYSMYCKQKYVYRRLLSLDNKGDVVPDSFKIPSACCCAYKQNLDFLSRMGKGP